MRAMIKRALSLYIVLFLAAGPLAAQVVESAGAGRGGAAPGAAAGVNSAPALTGMPVLPAASAGLAGSIAPSISPVLTVIETAAVKPEGLRALAADASPAAAYARALIAAPAAVSAAARAEAVKSMGEPAVARLETAVKSMKSGAAGTKAAYALKDIAAEFAALDNRIPETLAVAAPAAPVRAWRALKRAAIVATAVVTMAVIAPSINTNSVNIPANMTPVAMAHIAMAQVGGVTQTQADVVHANDINDAIAKWSPNVKLIIIGNPNLDAGAQRQLAAFLADKHWTVIIAESASGMSFRDVDGNTRYGKEALEFGAGQGIFRKGGFSGQVDATSGLADGSILVISMGDRYLYLRNSEAQRVNGLDGVSQFAGNLDQWAKARLRAGGDISGAVKETVTNIDARLQSAVANAAQNAASAIASAKSAVDEYAKTRAAFERSHASVAGTVGALDLVRLRAQLAAAEKALAAKNTGGAAQTASGVSSSANAAVSAMQGYESNFTSGKSALASAAAEVDALEKTSGAFLKTHPKATGDIARPDVRGMREKLKAAESALSANPSGAKSAASGVVSEVRRVQAALTEHAAGADQIAAAESLLSDLEGRAQAGDASPDLVTAKQSLREARESHDLGASTWQSQLQNAKSALANAERTITDAQAAAAQAALLRLWLMILAGLFTLGASTFLNWRARKARAKAQAELAKWDAILEKKLDTVIDQLDSRMDVYVGSISGDKSRGWVDETATLAAKVRQDAGKAKLYLAMARNIHDRATALVRPKAFTPGWIVNQFWPSRYAKAEAMLATEALTFKPQDGFDALFEKASDWRGDLYGEAKDYAPVSENFESVMDKFNAHSKTAVAALDEIEKASTGYGAAFSATEDSINAAANAASSTAVYDYFKVAALGSKIIPAAKETLAAARSKAEHNPVGAMKGQGALAERLAADAKALAEYAASMFRGEVGATNDAVKALDAASVGTKWIAESRAALDEQASKLAASLLKTEGASGLAALKAAYETHAANAANAKKGLAAIVKAKQDAGHAEAGVSNMRSVLGQALSLPAEGMLREKDTDPTQRLAAAAEAFADSLAKLGAGELAKAEAAQNLGTELVMQAVRITIASQKAVEDQAKDVEGRIQQAQRLDALQAERARVLKGIKSEFAESVLKQTAGDISHPSANGTIDDNIDEAEAAIGAAKSKRDKAVKVYREAKVLEAASLLSQAKAHEEIAQVRLDEISEKRARLDASVAANKSKVEELEATTRKWKTEIPDDARTMRPTIKAYEAAVEDIAAARKLVDATKGDPFKAQADLAAAETELKQLWVKLNNDRDAYAEVVRSLQAANTQLDSASSQARAAQGDGVADSPAITSAIRELENLKSAYTAAYAASQVKHGDWPKADAEADRITREAANIAASLSGEIQAAARATQAISNAGSQVREATNWTGSYGVSVPGSPGSGHLSSARSALNSGDYEGAIRSAERARSEAISAIQQAEAEVSRRRREEEEERRRQEEARRRREQEEADRRRRADEDSRRSSGGGFSSGGSSGGGGSSWSGGSSSGGGSSSW